MTDTDEPQRHFAGLLGPWGTPCTPEQFEDEQARVADLRARAAEDDSAVTLVLACVQCAAAQYEAANNGTADADLPPINAANVIAGGASLCFGHIQFGPAPIAPGRTASGLVLPGQGA